MAGPQTTPQLDRALAAVRRRLRARRITAFATLGVAVAVLLAGVAGVYAAGGPLFGLQAGSLASPGLVLLLALPVGVGVAVAFAGRAVPVAKAARELDVRLGLQDAASSALAVRALGKSTPLTQRVLDDAETAAVVALPRIKGAFPVRPAPWAGRWLLRAAAVAAVLWGLALVAALLPELPAGRNAGTPGGPGTEEGDTGLALAVARTPDTDPDGDPDADPDAEPEVEPEPESEPERPPTPEPPREPPIKARVRTSKAEYASHERVLAVVSAVPTVELAGDTRYDVRVVLDDVEIDTGLTLDVSPERVDPTARAFDVGELPPPNPGLKPGEHELKAILVPQDGGAPIDTESVRFRIRGPQDGGGSKPPPPKPRPRPEPEPPPEQKPQPPPPPPSGKQDGDGEPPEAEPPLPTALDRKVVMPLFGEGETIEKTGAVMVLDPSGGPARKPLKRPLGAALPGAVRRAEESLDRAGLRPEDRELIRRYFEGLGRLLR